MTFPDLASQSLGHQVLVCWLSSFGFPKHGFQTGRILNNWLITHNWTNFWAVFTVSRYGCGCGCGFLNTFVAPHPLVSITSMRKIHNDWCASSRRRKLTSCCRDLDMKGEGPRFTSGLGHHSLATLPPMPLSWYYSQECWENGWDGFTCGKGMFNFSIMLLPHYFCYTTLNSFHAFLRVLSLHYLVQCMYKLRVLLLLAFLCLLAFHCFCRVILTFSLF